MKRYFMLVAMSGLLFSGCNSTGNLTGTDDVYANPAEERALAKKQREDQARQAALEKEQAVAVARQNNENAERDKNNPYYKDPVYNADDYYDYEYASRINRFHSPVPGAAYYDPYYTNAYTYNQNPAFYGSSIYNNWGMPSSYFGVGVSSGWGYNPRFSYGMGYSNFYNGYSMYSPYCSPYYDPFCYNYGYYDPWGYNNAYYSGYNAGYYNGINNSYWGYYNAYDPNSNYKSVLNAPRSTGSGNNTGPRGGTGTRLSENSRTRQYIETVAAQQDNTPRFTESQRVSGSRAGQAAPNTQGTIQESGRYQNQNGQQQSGTQTKSQRRESSRRVYEAAPQEQQNNSQRGEMQQRTQTQTSERQSNPAPSNSGGRSSGGGGNSGPRNSSGGNSRPSR